MVQPIRMEPAEQSALCLATVEEDKALAEASKYMNPSEKTQAVLRARIERITAEYKKHKSEPKVDIPYVPTACFIGYIEERYWE